LKRNTIRLVMSVAGAAGAVVALAGCSSPSTLSGKETATDASNTVVSNRKTGGAAAGAVARPMAAPTGTNTNQSYTAGVGQKAGGSTSGGG